MPAFVIHLNDLRSEMRRWSFPITQEWLAAALKDTSLRPANASANHGDLTVSAQRNGTNDFLVQGQIKTDIVTDCARCLGDATVHVNVPMTVMMSPVALQTEKQNEDEVEVEQSDVLREYFDGPELVLDDVVRQHIILEEPMQPLCSPECKGIEARGKQENIDKVRTDSGEEIDPRLAPLLKFKQKLATKKEE